MEPQDAAVPDGVAADAWESSGEDSSGLEFEGEEEYEIVMRTLSQEEGGAAESLRLSESSPQRVEAAAANDVPPTAGSSNGFVADLFEEIRHANTRTLVANQHEHPPHAKLDHRKLQRNVKRLRRAVYMYIDAYQAVEQLQSWRNPYMTATALVLYLFSVRYQVLLPCTFLLVLGLFYRSYLEHVGYLPSSRRPIEEDAKLGLRDKVKALTSVAVLVQEKFGSMADMLEKVENLLRWEDPKKTWPVFRIVIAATAATILVPFDILCVLSQLAFGYKFFVSDAIFLRYPRMKEKYDTVHRFFMQLPTNEQLNRQTVQDGAQRRDEGAAQGSGPSHGAGSPREGPSTPAAGSASRRFGNDLLHQLGIPVEEEVLEVWHCLRMNPHSILKTKRGKAILTTSHFAFVRSHLDDHCFAFRLDRIESLVKAKPISLMPGKGFSLSFTVARDPGGTSSIRSDRYTVGGLLNRDEAYAAVCRQANLPCLL